MTEQVMPFQQMNFIFAPGVKFLKSIIIILEETEG